MSNFLKASRMKLRFQTDLGLLSTEQLWDMNLEELDALAVSLEKDYEESKGKSFLTKKTKKDKTIKLRFDIVLSILNTKAEEQELAQSAEAKKEHNQKLLALIQEKKNEELNGKSIEELEAMLQ